MTQAVGGDFFDVQQLPDGRIAVMFGDVAGHGISAALVTAMAKAALPVLLARSPDDPQQVLSELGAHLLRLLKKKKMMTFFLGILDPVDGRFAACNAGHCYPLLVPDPGCADDGNEAPTFATMPSTPLGISARGKRCAQDIDLTRHRLVLYSDAFVEATALDGQPVGYDRLAAMVGRVLAASERPLDDLFQELARLTGTTNWDDDASLVVVRKSVSSNPVEGRHVPEERT